MTEPVSTSRRSYASRLRADFRSYDTPARTRWTPTPATVRPTPAPVNYDRIVAELEQRRRTPSHQIGGKQDGWENGPWLRWENISRGRPS